MKVLYLRREATSLGETFAPQLLRGLLPNGKTPLSSFRKLNWCTAAARSTYLHANRIHGLAANAARNAAITAPPRRQPSRRA